MSLSAPLGPPLGPPVGGPLRRQPVPYEASYPAGVHNWVSPASAYYRFVLWGGGGVDGTNGGSGALAIAVRRVARGQIVALNVADGGAPSDDTTGHYGGLGRQHRGRRRERWGREHKRRSGRR
jgi:hypothetical protein